MATYLPFWLAVAGNAARLAFRAQNAGKVLLYHDAHDRLWVALDGDEITCERVCGAAVLERQSIEPCIAALVADGQTVAIVEKCKSGPVDGQAET